VNCPQKGINIYKQLNVGEGFMRVLSKIVSAFALWIFWTEWRSIQSRLISVYQVYLDKVNDGPSVLAQQLLISGEDQRFSSHGGIDPIAVLRAAWRTVVLKRFEGASTIEMQIVRVVTGRFERTLRRKVLEMCLATLVTRVIPKTDLPAVYLYIAYYGWRMNCFDAACRHLKLRPSSMAPIETARLVARLKYSQPSSLSSRRRQQIEARANHLLLLHGRHKVGYTYSGISAEMRYAAI
jgi:membrane carboxypeptidase/penicillin-binding protein PbpC